MIELTRLNGTPIVLNSDLIKTCEASPDTMITLINGEKLIVRDKLKQVVQRVLDYRARLLTTVAEQVPGAGMTFLEPVSRLDVMDRVEQADKVSQDTLRSIADAR